MRNINPTDLAEIIRKHKIWLVNQSAGEKADLRSADLSSADLSYADLSYADLSSADLSSADLSYANLSYADLRSANLSYANLRSANLSSANLRYANLSYANLRSADLSSADLSYANLRSANLSSADLRCANLSYADLRSADLSSANLRSANLRYADLRSADLRSADLRSADLKDTILADINWLAYIGILPNKSGTAYAYKVTKADGQGTQYSGIDYASAKTFKVDKCDPDVNVDCSYGINLANLAWALNSFTDKTYRLFMMKFNVKDAVCPVGSDGKFRVLECTKVGECDWTGNLKQSGG